MFEHLDDTELVHPGERELARTLNRADAIRARRRLALAVGSCCVLLAASIGLFFARPSSQTSLSNAVSAFNLKRGPLPVGLPVPTTALVDVQFVNPQSGFALALHGNSVFLAAGTNAGASWQVRNSRLPGDLASGSGAQIEFVGFTGYLWGDRTATGAPLWVTHDAGTTWHRAAIGPYVVDVSAIGPNVWALTSTCGGVGIGTSCAAEIEESLDGGNTWAVARPFDPSVEPDISPLQPIELARITGARAYVLTNVVIQNAAPSWQLYFTNDDGETWATRPVPCVGAFSEGAEVAASSSSDLWLLCGSQASAGSQSKQLYRSSDGGQTWALAASATGLGTPPPSTVTANPLPLSGYVAPFSVSHRNLAVASPTTAWLYPFRAGLYKTMEGGQNWVSVPALSAAGFDSGGEGNITFLSASQGWICDYGVGLWHTNDGVNWFPLGNG